MSSCRSAAASTTNASAPSAAAIARALAATRVTCKKSCAGSAPAARSRAIARSRSRICASMTERDRTLPTGMSSEAAPDRRRVFVIYGHNLAAYQALVAFLRALGLRPWSFEELSSELGGAPYVEEIVREGLRRSHAVLVL